MDYSKEYIEDRIPKLRQLISNKGLPDFLRKDYKKELIQLEDMLEEIELRERRRKAKILQTMRRRRKRRCSR